MGSIKSDKIVAIIEVIVLLILMIAYFIKVCLPDIKKNIGTENLEATSKSAIRWILAEVFMR